MDHGDELESNYICLPRSKKQKQNMGDPTHVMLATPTACYINAGFRNQLSLLLLHTKESEYKAHILPGLLIHPC